MIFFPSLNDDTKDRRAKENRAAKFVISRQMNLATIFLRLWLCLY